MSLKTQIVSLRLRSDRQLIYLRSDFKSTLCNVIAKSLSPAVTNHFVTSYKSLNFVRKWFLTATEKDIELTINKEGDVVGVYISCE